MSIRNKTYKGQAANVCLKVTTKTHKKLAALKIKENLKTFEDVINYLLKGSEIIWKKLGL